MKKQKTKSSSKTLNNSSEVTLTLRFHNPKSSQKFVEQDALETYLHVISKKWSDLTPSEQKQVQNIDNYVSNTNFTISIINQIFIESLEDLRRHHIYDLKQVKEKYDKWKQICRTINKKDML